MKFVPMLKGEIMPVLVFKTNINNEQKYNYVTYLFRKYHQIKNWSIDREDVDNVLRIETSEKLNKSAIIRSLASINIQCDELN